MIETKHTSLPWHYSAQYSDRGHKFHAIENSSFDDILSESGYIKKEDAEFIVKCVNNHYQLLGALQELSDISDTFFGSSELEDATVKAQQAIKDAL